MYDKILVPTDGSDCAAKALEHAEQLADMFDAEIHLLYVVDVRMNTAGEYYANMMGNLREAGSKRLDKISEDLDRDKVVSKVVEGVPHTEINDYAEENGIELVVMGTHGRTGLNRLLIGSTTEKIVRTSNVPVMTVGNEKEEK